MHIEKGDKHDDYKFMPLKSTEYSYQKNVDGKNLNKTIIIHTERGYALLVLPYNYRINYSLLNRVVSDRSKKLNNLYEVHEIFPDYVHSTNAGNINMNDLPVYIFFVTDSPGQKECAYDAGNFLDVMVTSYKH